MRLPKACQLLPPCMESISQTRIEETIQTTHLALVDENNLSTGEKNPVYRKNDCQGKIKERGFLIMSFISASISIFVFCKISWKRFEIHLREKEKAGHVSCLQTFTLIACWSRNWECPPRTWHRNQLLTNIRHIFDQNLNISSPGIFPGHLSVCSFSSPLAIKSNMMRRIVMKLVKDEGMWFNPTTS